MIARACYALGLIAAFVVGILVPCPSAAERDYFAAGTLHISSDGPEKQVCELRIGSSTDAKRKILIVSTPDMAVAQFCRDHVTDHASLTLRFAQDFHQTARQDGTR